MDSSSTNCTPSGTHPPNKNSSTLAEERNNAFSKDTEKNRQLIVNYLPQIFTNLELRNLFAPYGEIESVRIMKDSKTGYSYGYGFVNFVQEEDAVSAKSTLNGFELQNKHLKVSFARPPSDDIKHTNLYITNLPRNTTEPDLLKLFQPYGKIIQKKLLYDKYTNLPRGVAFVRYESREQASNAIQALHELVPDGQFEPIRVRLADDHGKRRASYLAGFQAGMGIASTRSTAHHHDLSHTHHGRRSPHLSSSSGHSHKSHTDGDDGTGSRDEQWPHESRHNKSYTRNTRREKPYHR